MKKTIAAVLSGLLLCCAPAAFAQDSNSQPPAAPSAGQAQAAVGMLQKMSPEQRQQLMESGVDQVQDLSPEKLKEYKSMFDSLPPDQKQQLESQVEQQIQNDPKLKAEAEQKLKNLTPEQKQQLEDEGQ